MIFIKNKGFSFYETILSIFILTIFFNFAFLKYKEYRINRSIVEAKLKINDAFFYSSISSLRSRSTKTLKINFISKKIIILNNLYKKEKEISLPKNLAYYSTYSSNSQIFNISFTKNGNISQSFSIYIFDANKHSRYKISLYGFDRSKFLKINNYRHIGKKIKLSEIFNYHRQTNEDRKEFYIDWKKE